MNLNEKQPLSEIWRSPIKAEEIAAGSIKLSETRFDQSGQSAYWLESRPLEGGRNVVVKWKDGETIDLIPEGFNTRTLVHEYGGGSYAIMDHGGTSSAVVFVNYKDQRLYLVTEGKTPRAITPEGPWRYADLVFDSCGKRIICVMEIWHENESEPQNVIAGIALPFSGEELGFSLTESKFLATESEFDSSVEAHSSAGPHCAAPEVICSGHDFYAFPRLNDKGDLLAFIAWDHPNMPWDESRLFLARINEDKTNCIEIAGGVNNSVYQPLFGPEGTLYFAAEDTGWWNIYRLSNPEAAFESPADKIPVILKSAEFGLPIWVFATSIFDVAADGASLYSAYCQKGIWNLALLQYSKKRNDYSLNKIQSPFTDIDYLCASGKFLLFIGGGPNMVRSVVLFDTGNETFQILKTGANIEIAEGYISVPENIEYSGANGETAYAFFYPPKNKDYEYSDVSEDLHSSNKTKIKPPLIVRSHGGPTSSSDAVLNLTYQFWTSRGFAVIDVNYGGSTGFGRKYRNRLIENWGIVDMLDCQAAAQALIDKGMVDSTRVCIAGGSAGGYTTLCALTFSDRFNAGCSYYGIGDLKALMRDTHKFESRYLDSLVGPYPEAEDAYFKRSPINFTDRLNCPVIFFQGLEDKVVPPSQTEKMVQALRDKKVPVAYLAYEGEQHGFRKAENIKRTLEAELFFYAKVFELDLSEKNEPISVHF